MNKNCETIHETVIPEIIDTIKLGAKALGDKIKSGKGDKSWRSIAQASSNLVLVFPVITTKNISIENASMISKAIERKAVMMLQMLFSSTSLNSMNADDVVQYVKKFHTNINFGDMTVDDFMTTMDSLVEAGHIQITDKEMYDAIKEDMRNIAYTLPENISENSINDYKLHNTPYGQNIVLERQVNFDNYDKELLEKLRQENEDLKSKNSELKDRKYMNDLKDKSNLRKDQVNFFKDQITVSDVKKANELVPTGVIVNFIDGQDVSRQAIIGVKAKLYPIDSMDIINRIKLKNQDNNGFLNFIRASTREISFWKDFIFAIDNAKLDALASSKRGSTSKMWKVLERRAINSRIRRSIKSTNTGSAISTLVLSQEEVEYLKKYDNIDIENVRIIRAIMESYNLMGICIVDEANEVAKFLFDTGDDIYESISFRNLERESSNNDMKKIINLMTKVAR